MARKQASLNGTSGNSIGERVRDRRKSLGLSLRGLSEQVALSASFIAQVERGEVIPSIPSLQSIAYALKVPMFYFFTEEQSKQRVVREGDRRKIHFPNSNIIYELLLPNLSQKNMGLIIHLGKNDHIQPLQLSAPTEEWMLLVKGKIAVRILDETYELGPGDSIFYEGWELQDTMNISEEESILVLSMTPPAF
jgi:transcriptional regulator with XRE-family HTH domain